ncbi:MAG: nonstructural protein [Arizlama microvirus]|nr:MAG: nonstructural protein [Arizlama microvirus]
MIQKIFTVYDSKVEAYLQPFFLPSKGAALRAITDVANDPSHMFGKHPEDYVLFELGTFDDQDCKFDLYAAPISMGVVLEFVRNSD